MTVHDRLTGARRGIQPSREVRSTVPAAGADPARLRRVLWTAIGLGAVVSLSAVPSLSLGSAPAAWRLGITALVFLLGEMALLHIRFGDDQQSFTWSETAVVVGLVLVPSPWMRVLVPVAVGLAHVLGRRPPTKVAFNALSVTVGAFVARVVFGLAGGRAGHFPESGREWLALAVAPVAFFVWNSISVSAVVAASQGMPTLTVLRKGLPLNVLVWAGNSAMGVMLVFLAVSQPTMLFVVPGLLAILYVVYWSYLRAMQERDTWQVLQATSKELLQVEAGRVAEVVVERAPALLGAQFVELTLADGEPTTRARVFRSDGSGRVEERVDARLDPTDPFWGRALCEREPFHVDVATASAAQRAELEALGLTCCVVAPLMAHDHCQGTLRIGFRGDVRLRRRERQVLTTFANHVSAAVQNTRLFAEIRDQALQDPLTGLPNRTLLLDRLHQALARGARDSRGVAVLFLDLDRFKVVNDSLGHDVGDRVLVAAARRIESVLRPGDTAARFGGDEFVVLCEDVADEHQALEIAQRLAASLEGPFSVRDVPVYLTSSIGLVMSQAPDDDPVALLRDADAAMYQAKARGPARVEVFDDTMRQRVVARLETENDLRRAIERGELRLHYQPNVDLTELRVRGAEALLRWEHPQRGVVGPSEFVPLAEETALIVPLGTWVLNEACRQLATWMAPGGGAELPADFTMSVNLSPLQLADPGLVQEVARALVVWDIPPPSLCLEITETAVMADLDVVLDTLRRLKDLGVRIALDDFGTGYSSLSYLHRLPVDVLKLDQSFVARLEPDSRNRAIVAGMVELAHALDLTVVAEGVETDEQVIDLRHLECDLGQGHHFCRPQPPDRLWVLLGDGLTLAPAAAPAAAAAPAPLHLTPTSDSL